MWLEQIKRIGGGGGGGGRKEKSTFVGIDETSGKLA